MCPYDEYLAQYRRILVQALAALGRPTCTASGTHLVKRRTLLLGLQHQTRPSAEWAERRTRTASRRTCVCVRCVPVPPRCAQHRTACASALCTADESSSSRAMCSTLRPAGALVHDEARSLGICYSASAVWASLPAGSASADGERRRHIRRNQQRGEGWGKGWAGL
jgi:hypothetical protein